MKVKMDTFTFIVTNENDSDNSKIMVEICGVSLDMLIDPGASCNIVDIETWERLKQMKTKCKTNKDTKKVFCMVAKIHLRLPRHFVQI